MPATDATGFERLEALLRGEEPVTPAERRQAALLAELRAGAPPGPERLRARVLAAKPAPRRLPSRRLALVLAAAVLGVAVLAAAVHGVVSPQPAAPVAVRMPAPAAKSAPAQGAAAPSLGAAPAPEALPRAPSPPQGRGERMLRSALDVLALEGWIALAVLGAAGALAVAAGAVLAAGTARRRRDTRRLL